MVAEPAQPPFHNPVWQALQGPHQHLGHLAALAARYQPDVAPSPPSPPPPPRPSPSSPPSLSPAKPSGSSSPPSPTTPHFTTDRLLPGLQMLLPADTQLSAPRHEILPLAAADLPDMLALIALAYPGFFLPGTPRMGAWFGIRVAGTLVAMAGERFFPPGWPEISGLCTHPAHRGHGYAASLLAHLTHRHRERKLRSWLEVAATNARAIALYHQLGFRTAAEVTFQLLRRTP